MPVHFPIITTGQESACVVYEALQHEGLRLRRGDILAVASKIISTCENRIVKLKDVRVTPQAKFLARRWKIDQRLAAVVSREADNILGGVNGFLLTITKGLLTPNAGVDLKNSPPGTATLWPANPDRSARQLRRNLQRRYKTTIGVEIVDSRVTALRLGTTGLAIGVSGFAPVRDRRGVRDIFGRPIRVTQANVADDIAAVAHLIMGESTERIGAVLIRGAAVAPDNEASGQFAKLTRKKCLIGSSLVTALVRRNRFKDADLIPPGHVTRTG
jgi:coenzyme F420-0:L-glutamate ligase